jgi:hypothetical protein
MSKTIAPNAKEPPQINDEIIRAVSSPGLFRVTRQFIDDMVGRLVADQVQEFSDAEFERSLGPCIAGAQLVSAAKKLRDVGVLGQLVDHLRKEDGRIRELADRVTQMRQSAYIHLDELRIKLMEDPTVYAKHRGKAAAVIDDYVNGLIERVRNEKRYTNTRYDGQGELAASLICLAMDYPQTYAALMEHAAGTDGIRLLNGISGLERVLGGLSDDHDYILIQDSDGLYQLYHESNKPPRIGFVPLTCARDLAELTCSLLTQAGATVQAAANSPAR